MPPPPKALPALPDRLPPQSLDAEQATLGAALISKNAAETLLEILVAEDFYWEAHRSVYRAIQQLHSQDVPADSLTVPDELQRVGRLKPIGEQAYINLLVDSVPTAAHIEYYARTVREKSHYRELIDVGGDLVAKSYEQIDLDDILESTQRRLYALECGSQGTPTIDTAASLAIGFNDRLGAANQGKYVPGVSTGYRSLDRYIIAFRAGYHYVVGGRPGAGKTAALGNFARNALRQGTPVGVFSMEMGADQLWNRLLAIEAGVNSMFLERLDIPPHYLETVRSANSRAADWPLYVEDATDLTIRSVRARARQMRRKHQVEVILVDYIQLVCSERGREEDVQHFTAVAKGLQSMAKELGCAVVSLSQLSRGVEGRAGNRPRLADLRESGAIEAAADAVILLYSDNYYLKLAGQPLKKPWLTEFIIAKHRHGPTGIVKLEYTPHYTAFSEPSEPQPDLQEELPL